MKPPAQQNDAEPEPPESVGGYRIVRRLGGGGMGSVYEAEEPSIRRRVAIKVLRRRFADDPDLVDRFQNEARLANSVQHPAIVDAFAFGRLDDGRPYFVMPLLEGAAVRELLEKEGRLSPARSWSIAREVAEALGVAHAAGLVHRDLKPDNVFIERLGGRERVRVLDFGIAKSVEPSPETAQPTRSGLLLGTPAYMAPEQWWGAELDARVDQYALGVMLFELLCGSPPFDPAHPLGVMKLHLHEAPPELASRGIAVPRAVEAFVWRLLAKEREQRFDGMAEVIAAGDVAFGSPQVPEPARAPAAARRSRAAHAALVVVALGLVLATGYAGEHRWDPAHWFVISGWVAYLVAGAYAAAVLLVPLLGKLRFRGLVRTLAIAPAILGALGTHAGWEVVLRALARVDATRRFGVFNEGAYEAGANRFLGFSLAIGTCLSLAALAAPAAPQGAPQRGRPAERSTAALAVVVVACGVLAAVAGAPSAVLVAGSALAFFVSSLLLPIARKDGGAELERGVFGVLAVLLASGAALERVSGRATILWTEQPTREARVQEILAAAAERSATIAVAAGVLGIVILALVLRLREAQSLPRPGPRHLAVLGLLVAGLVADVVLAARFQNAGASTRAALEEQFALFAQLDPPSTDLLDPVAFAPREGPALQIARSVVAVNGHEVSRLAAVETAAGRARVQDALFEALARASEAPLSCLVDRNVRWSQARELLGIAHLAGATEAELLFTRGRPPRIPTVGPPEVTYVEPTDFVAVPVVLTQRGDRLDGERTFGELAAGLVADAKARRPIELGVAEAERARSDAGRDPGR